ncbi:MAG: GNAT family N-acetyltransferase [Lentisphaeraceae bacterium]|nr:GNAT family N-acetyltransferase [Lentisphaeraceae bacterium]
MKLTVHNSFLDFKSSEWNKLVPENFPFAKHQFFSSLEESESIGKRTGWYPFIISAHDTESLVGLFILFVKTNSYGEYIFDWAWADAWKKTGQDYYPKLTSAIPFTPATGPKFLVSPNADYETTCKLLVSEALKEESQNELSSTHILFTTPRENGLLINQGFKLRKTFQFHWQNNNYASFEDFLSELKQKKRQKIRRERKEINKLQNLEIKEVTGKDALAYAKDFYQLYLSTIDKKWSADYLTEGFFQLLFERMNENILLYLAFKDDKLVAGTLNIIGGDKIFGRYWGAFEDIQHLHFELCYYQPIEFAIRHKIDIFEAGAQGEHKIQRGFTPAYTYSLHKLPESKLTELIHDSIDRESEQADRLVREGRAMVFKETN